MTTANKFTIIRLIMVIPFIIILTIAEILKENISYLKINTTTLLFLIAGVLFILAMITDIIDGYIARKTNTITNFGKLFDPLADKLITISSFIFFATFKIINIHLVIIFVIRDLLVNGFKNIAIKNNKKFSSNIYGKLKTFFQTIAIILIFFILPLINNNTQQITNSWQLYILNIPVYISLLLSLISGWTYFWNIKSLIKFT